MPGSIFDPFHVGGSGGGVHSILGSEFIRTDDGTLVPAFSTASAVQGHGGSSSSGGANGSTGSPTSTLVGSSTGLEINLIWDASVQSSASWKSVEAAVISAAQLFTSTFSNHVVLNIDIGLGEINGAPLAQGALGESESSGYITSYGVVTNALAGADAALVSSGQLSANALASSAADAGHNFFVTSAEAKALGLVNPSSGVDGFIGLIAGSSLYYPANGGAIGPGQYDAVGAAAHEISEVMGRIGMEGQSLGATSKVYTPLDLFRYTAPGALDLTPTAAYFSTNGGLADLQNYNNPSNGGDAADWATSPTTAKDAFDAFGTPGVIENVTATDLLEVAVLGFHVAAGKTLAAVTA